MGTATMTFSGSVEASATGRVFLCHPIDSDYQAISISLPNDSPLMGGFSMEVDVADAFAPGTYTLEDFRSTAWLRIVSDGTTYTARQSADRTADEQAKLTLTSVTPPNGDDPCSGFLTGTLTVALV
jgi:hypothetical protein